MVIYRIFNARARVAFLSPPRPVAGSPKKRGIYGGWGVYPASHSQNLATLPRPFAAGLIASPVAAQFSRIKVMRMTLSIMQKM